MTLDHKLRFENAEYVAKITIKLENGRLSICGDLYSLKYGPESSGQNIDSIADKFPTDATVQRIKAVWERWHLNDMRAGSAWQEKFLRTYPVNAVYPESHYDKATKALTDAGLNPAPDYIHNGKPYLYGHAWLKEELPAEIIAEVTSWQATTESKAAGIARTSKAALCRASIPAGARP